MTPVSFDYRILIIEFDYRIFCKKLKKTFNLIKKIGCLIQKLKNVFQIRDINFRLE
jgi:hypothetical protein